MMEVITHGNLLARARNVNSQFGEDGIIEAILAALPSRDKWCVEFGAWDGRYLSNTRRLIDEEGYRGIMIEADTESFSALERSTRGNDRVTCIQGLVGFSEEDGLDRLLEKTPCPLGFDLVSIDIDGNDLHVWAAMKKYRPKVVCIEFNPTIPTSVNFAQPANKNIKWGCSLFALFTLAVKKRYRLVCANEINAFFVTEELWSGSYASCAEDLLSFRKTEPTPTFLFSGYDGTVLLSSDAALGWHGLSIRGRDVQILPKFLRRYPADYTSLQRKLFGLLRRLRG
jgi:hypothetical protein